MEGIIPKQEMVTNCIFVIISMNDNTVPVLGNDWPFFPRSFFFFNCGKTYIEFTTFIIFKCTVQQEVHSHCCDDYLPFEIQKRMSGSVLSREVKASIECHFVTAANIRMVGSSLHSLSHILLP